MIKAIITDFDGTVADTFEANYQSYRDVFVSEGLTLGREQYRECYGLRFDSFMERMGISDADMRERIRHGKAERYPNHFDLVKPNKIIIRLIERSKESGVATAIASTARRENLERALQYLGIEGLFDVVVAGEAVRKGKPDPEIYQTCMSLLGVSPEETLIFEDSETGLAAAERSGAAYLKITQNFFE